jgi:YD repeat-containing protein
MLQKNIQEPLISQKETLVNGTVSVGITAQCDAANRTTYYDYDTFSRLKLIRDMDGNILKSFDYKYRQQP